LKVLYRYSNYINENQNAANASEMRSLLVKSYLYSGNFKETLNAIDSLQSSSPEINKVDQEVSYLLGTEEFNKGNYDEAEKYFLRSLGFNINKEFNSRALYWLGQVYYQKGNYPSAIVRYEKLLNENFPENSSCLMIWDMLISNLKIRSGNVF
jgi:tetratricopeptide (TPR) repeat protein